MKVFSPITLTDNVTLIKTISTKWIIENYYQVLKIDVSDILKDIDCVKLYKCNDSEYYFYYPFNISGTSHFYQKLQNFDWYYLTDKWEYNYALRYISAYSQLLEIGAGSGHFLLKAHKEKKVHIVGLELNDHAIKQAEENNVKIIKDNLESFSLNNPNCFDIVASFQVLEHITNVKIFLNSSLKLLKKMESL